VTETADAVVVGAGPAGSAAATLLAGCGRKVLLLDKDSFPRPKVCGEFLSADAVPSLERLGARDAVLRATAERMTRGTFHLPSGRAVPFALPEPAIGISRLCLDDLLARRARDAGADVRFGARVLAAAPAGTGGFVVRVVERSAETFIETRAVIGAWGRWDALDRSLDRGFLRGSPYFGWSRDYENAGPSLRGEVRLYLFAGGYCGLSRVEGGAINLAGVISETAWKRAGGGWSGVLLAARRSNPALDAALSGLAPGPVGFLGTGPVFFTAKPPVENGILMAGDAAGVLDPFSGEGMSAALASGILAADVVERGLAGDLSRDESARVYETEWRRRFARRFAWSAAFRRLILHPTIGAVAGRLAGEKLVRFAISATRS
jgi:flavin-dependent dehydrogenase